jgi:HK97 family phage major capsid protein
MKTSRNFAIFVMAALVGVCAYAAADPVISAFLAAHLDLAGGLALLANAPVLAPEMKTLVEGIQRGFEDFKRANDQKQAQSDSDFQAKMANITADLAGLMDMKRSVEALELKAGRQGLGGGSEQDQVQAEYKAGFINQFVRKGQETGLKALESKAWSIGTSADGGYALPKSIETEVEKLARDLSPMRSLARVIKVGTSDYHKLVNVNGIASGWVGETAARSATNTSQFADVVPPMGEVYANPQVTQVSLDDMFFDAESELIAQLSEELAVAEGAAFVTGNGTNKPKGFLAYTTAATADSSRAFATIEHIATGVSGDFPASNKADYLYDIVARLKAAYRAGSNWTMGKALMFEIMKLKDTTGQYLWQPMIDDGLVMNLLGYPVFEAEDMPVKAANSLSLAFGNFKRGYLIVDRVGIRMLRDPYSNKPYVGFYTTKRVGGAVINSEAIKIGKFSVS